MLFLIVNASLCRNLPIRHETALFFGIVDKGLKNRRSAIEKRKIRPPNEKDKELDMKNPSNPEIKSIWKALTNLDKADIQTTALCHAIVTLLIEKGVGSEQEIAQKMEESIPKVMKVRKEIAEALSDPLAVFNSNMENVGDETIH